MAGSCIATPHGCNSYPWLASSSQWPSLHNLGMEHIENTAPIGSSTVVMGHFLVMAHLFIKQFSWNGQCLSSHVTILLHFLFGAIVVPQPKTTNALAVSFCPPIISPESTAHSLHSSPLLFSLLSSNWKLTDYSYSLTDSLTEWTDWLTTLTQSQLTSLLHTKFTNFESAFLYIELNWKLTHSLTNNLHWLTRLILLLSIELINF
jgi:hypothetical protein